MDTLVLGEVGCTREVLGHETAARFPSALEWLFSPADIREEIRSAITSGQLLTDVGYSEVASTIALLATAFGSDYRGYPAAIRRSFETIGLPPNLVAWEPLEDDAVVVPSTDCISSAPYFPALCGGYVRALGPEFGGLMSLDGLAAGLTAMCRNIVDQTEYGTYLASSEPDHRWDETWNRVTRFVGGWELTEANELTLRSPASGVRAVVDRSEAVWRVELHH